MEKKLFEIASKVATPLSLSSIIMIALYLIYKSIIGLGIFGNLKENNSFILLSTIVDRLFSLALVALILGVIAYLFVARLKLPQKYTITGNVLSADGTPVKDVVVLVEGVDRRKETDLNGWFQIEVDAQDIWVVRAYYKDRTAKAGVARQDARKPITLTLSTQKKSEKNKRILLIEDEPAVHESAGRILGDTVEVGKPITAVKSREMLLRELTHQNPDGIILDLEVPPSGTLIYKWIREWNKNVPIVFYTRHANTQRRLKEMLDVGAALEDIFDKKESVTDLQDMLNRIKKSWSQQEDLGQDLSRTHQEKGIDYEEGKTI
jgi:CheY-like chemotaxis protein